MKIKIVLIISIILSGCVSGYQQFYTPYLDARTLSDVQLLPEGQDPEVFGTDNFDRDTLTLQSKNYLVVGQSSFNGSLEGIGGAKAQAKKVGASVVLIGSQYTNTQTTTSTLFVPTTQTTYHSGTVSGNTTYNSLNSGYSGSSNTFGNYSGTSTTYGTQAVPITTQQRRYDQAAVFFVKSTKKWQVGVIYKDLSVEQRRQYGRNTGVIIGVVIEDSPAFYANVLPGDVLIAVDGKPAINVNQTNRLWDSALAYKKLVKLTVIRQGQEEIIELLTK